MCPFVIWVIPATTPQHSNSPRRAEPSLLLPLIETVKALRQARPIYIIDSALPPLFEDYDRYHPPVIKQFLQENYDYEGRIYFADVYRLKEGS